jgi:hypothetical protein
MRWAAGKTALAADGFIRTQQNASVHDLQGFNRVMSVNKRLYVCAKEGRADP